MSWLLVIIGVLVAIALSLLIAFVLRHQNLHLQVTILRQIVRRARSPWAKENAMWRELNSAVQNIPPDLVNHQEKD